MIRGTNSFLKHLKYKFDIITPNPSKLKKKTNNNPHQQILKFFQYR